MKITFDRATDMEGHPHALTVVLNDGYSFRASAPNDDDKTLVLLLRTSANAVERHLKATPEIIVGPALREV